MINKAINPNIELYRLLTVSKGDNPTVEIEIMNIKKIKNEVFSENNQLEVVFDNKEIVFPNETKHILNGTYKTPFSVREGGSIDVSVCIIIEVKKEKK
jgi:hypothetical protein